MLNVSYYKYILQKFGEYIIIQEQLSVGINKLFNDNKYALIMLRTNRSNDAFAVFRNILENFWGIFHF